ncbi:hypothetical protein CHARACLAT_000406 [Characodon lateralis]|uniref:Uncharacterized protein n=1 Tax=Characodon lateralis TaxID=208331 RepID=A0ABU7EGZ1_9TELE|nr:hypothetical protein [Characodon lateralis]
MALSKSRPKSKNLARLKKIMFISALYQIMPSLICFAKKNLQKLHPLDVQSQLGHLPKDLQLKLQQNVVLKGIDSGGLNINFCHTFLHYISKYFGLICTHLSFH